jgi:hypothetical protein
MTDDEAGGPDGFPDEAGMEPAGEQLDPVKIAAAERKFVEAREAWLREREARRDAE